MNLQSFLYICVQILAIPKEDNRKKMFGLLPSLPNKEKKVKDSGQRKICECREYNRLGVWHLQ